MNYFNATDISPKELNETVYVFYNSILHTDSRTLNTFSRINDLYPQKVLDHFLISHGLRCRYNIDTPNSYLINCSNYDHLLAIPRETVLNYFAVQTVPFTHLNHSRLDLCILSKFKMPAGWHTPLHWNNISHEEQLELVKYYD